MKTGISDWLEFRRDMLRAYQRKTHSSEKMIEMRMAWIQVYLVNDLQLAHRILTDHANSLSKRSFGYKALRNVLKTGVLVSDGDAWRIQRRVLQPLFHEKALAGYEVLMKKEVSAWCDALAKKEPTPVKLADEMTELAFRIIGSCLFGANFSIYLDEMRQALPIVLNELAERSSLPIFFPRWWPTARNFKFVQAMDRLHAVIDRIIEAETANSNPLGLVCRMIAAKDPVTGNSLTKNEIHDQVLTLIVAGHETTASQLSWAIASLAHFPEWQEKIKQNETFADQILLETLRLYPALWVFGRRVEKEITTDGIHLKKGAILSISPFILQRKSDEWIAPQEFNPERFLDPALGSSLLSFGAGPRACMGRNFALLEARTALLEIVRRFQILPMAPVPDPITECSKAITLRLPENHLVRFKCT
jgi:cytochrome P450